MTDTPAPSTAHRRQTWIDRGERYGLLVAWLAVIIVFGILRPTTFLSWMNFSTIFGSQAVLVVLTLGLIIPLTAGDYDLSIAGNLTLSSMTIAVLNVLSKRSASAPTRPRGSSERAFSRAVRAP